MLVLTQIGYPEHDKHKKLIVCNCTWLSCAAAKSVICTSYSESELYNAILEVIQT